MAQSDSGGSGSDFSGGLPRMQMDSASDYQVASSFAALRSRPTQPIIGDYNWHSDDPQDFQQRFAVGPYDLQGEPRTVPKYPGAPPSNASSSMAVAIHQSQYSSSLYTPSLAGRSATTASSGPSARTSSGNSALSRYQAAGRLEEGDDGMLFSPDTGRWQCPYGFLGCNEWLDSMEDWDNHCLSHFRRRENLPKHVYCPFLGCSWSFGGASGDQAWGCRRTHIWACHYAGGSIDAFRRPDKRMVEHLWRVGLINEAQKKELRTTGHLSGNDVYLVSASSSRDRRRERRGGEGRDPRSLGTAGGYSGRR